MASDYFVESVKPVVFLVGATECPSIPSFCSIDPSIILLEQQTERKKKRIAQPPEIQLLCILAGKRSSAASAN